MARNMIYLSPFSDFLNVMNIINVNKIKQDTIYSYLFVRICSEQTRDAHNKSHRYYRYCGNNTVSQFLINKV